MSNFQEAFSRLDQFIQQKMQSVSIPGLSVALTDREKLLGVFTYGFADVAAHIPVTPQTLFAISSLTKSCVSIALLQKRDAGQLDLHAPVRQYLPWFHVQSRYAPITVHHLMCHTAGIVQGTGSSRYKVWALRETETGFAPGDHFWYSNLGYQLLGCLLEELLGQNYSDIVQSHLLDPLGMSTTDPVITQETWKRLALGYQHFYDDRPDYVHHPLVQAPWLEYGTGDGSIASTPADIATYVRMLLNQGQGPQGRLLSEESFRLMTQHAIQMGKDMFYGYGLVMRKTEGHSHLLHSGRFGTGYYQSLMLADLDDGLGIIVLVNGPRDVSDVPRFALKLLRAAMHRQEMPSLPPVSNPTHVENAVDYIGTYKAGAKTFMLTNEHSRLILHYGSERIALERCGQDSFYVDHPDFRFFLLNFQREGKQVVEAFCGPDWYTNEHYTGLTTFVTPQEWEAYPGHYRSYNPLFPSFRVVLRKGRLVQISPSGYTQILVPLGNGVFRVGEQDHSPERICFDAIVNTTAQLAKVAGCGDYHRSFTP
jgi:D-alanyl-D-alanine carboxypeptidase